MNEDFPTKITELSPKELSRKAMSASPDEQLEIVHVLVEKLADTAQLTVDHYATSLAKCGACKPTTFKKAVKEAALKASVSSETFSLKPTDDDLAKLWREDHPNTAFGLGDWRRYADGVWSIVPMD